MSALRCVCLVAAIVTGALYLAGVGFVAKEMLTPGAGPYGDVAKVVFLLMIPPFLLALSAGSADDDQVRWYFDHRKGGAQDD